MNQKICQYCGGLLVATIIGNSIVYSHCAKENHCELEPHTQERQFSSFTASVMSTAVSGLASTTTTVPFEFHK